MGDASDFPFPVDTIIDGSIELGFCTIAIGDEMFRIESWMRGSGGEWYGDHDGIGPSLDREAIYKLVLRATYWLRKGDTELVKEALHYVADQYTGRVDKVEDRARLLELAETIRLEVLR